MTAAPAPPRTGAGFQLSHRQVLVVFSGLMLGMFLAALDQTIVATALPRIVGELHGLDHLSWVVTAYLLTSTASTPLYGKISDLYGRKPVFQFSIVVFLVGSALAGLSQNMPQLIATRAIQGLGGGGLMAMAFAIIGDVVSPRERGRYQGYFGAVFATASVLGPLLGGFFVDNLSWRWVFYINVPIGIVALIVTSAVLNLPFQRHDHKVDYLGASTLVASVTALLLVTVWGGTRYPWGSPTIIALAVGGVALAALFVWWEGRAAEPILPPRLYRISVFNVSSAMSFIVGLAMFGAIIFLPLYLQLVNGVSPTASGLLLLPLMAGILTSSIVSGLVITRIGRYKVFPIVGMVLLAVGFWLMTHLGAHTGHLVSSAFMVVLGLGMGLTMQVLVLATQNAVDVRDLGTATSAVTFFRSMGGAFGTALFQAVLNARLDHWLGVLAPGTGAGAEAFSGGPQAVRALAEPARSTYIEAFVRSLDAVFWVAIPIVAVAFLLSLMLKELRLRDASGMHQAVAESTPSGEMVVSAESIDEDLRAGTPAGRSR